MWFAARDVAFESPVTEDETARHARAHGHRRGRLRRRDRPSPTSAQALANRVLPDDIDFDLESLLTRMIGLLFIEISAFHAFSWAETVLADPDARGRRGRGRPPRLVHPGRRVARTSPTSRRCSPRCATAPSSASRAGATQAANIVGPIWDRGLEDSLGVRRNEQLDTMRREVEHAVRGRADKADLLAEFDALGSVQRAATGDWVVRTES